MRDQPGVLAQLDELVGRDEAAIGLRPAQQGLQRGRAAIAGVPDRLEVQLELVVDGGMDAPGQAQAVGQPRGHCRIEPDHHVALGTRRVRGLRGHADHLLGAVAVTGSVHGHTDARFELVQ